MDIESQISTLAANLRDDELQRNLHELGQCMTALRSAEEGYVTAMTRDSPVGGSDELIRSAHQTVIDRRRRLQVALEPVAAQTIAR